MKKPEKEAVETAGHIHIFLHEYAPAHLTSSRHTLKSYRTALFLFFTFLEGEKGIRSTSLKAGCFSRANIEQWVEWLMNVRNCASDTANNRLASLRVFLKYLGSRDLSYLYFYQESHGKKGCAKKSAGCPGRPYRPCSKPLIFLLRRGGGTWHLWCFSIQRLHV